MSLRRHHPGASLNRRASHSASAYLSRIEGRSIAVKSAGRNPAAWQRQMARAHQRIGAKERQREKQAASELRNQQWLEQEGKQWAESRRSHGGDEDEKA